MSDYDDSCDEEDDYGILKKALAVEVPENFDPNSVPQTGEEYLQHVIYERTKCKTWVTANIDRSKFKNQTFKIELGHSLKRPASCLLPHREWQDSKIEDFTNLRQFVRFKLSKDPTKSSFDEETFLDRTHKEHPQFSNIILFSQAGKIRMLQLISKHLESIPHGSSFAETVGVWLYAILTLLEKPLSPDSCYTLREFAKRCMVVRANLEDNSSPETYTPLNLFICIVARYFHQLDLADP